MLRGPVALDDLVTAALRLIGEHLQNLDGGARRIQRLDQRLLNGDRAVEGARIAPGFQVVRLRQVPLADLGGLVVVQAQVDAHAGLVDPVAHAQFDRRIEGRIAAEDQQQVHRAGVQILHQVLSEAS